jgi:CHASE3 domain sensor protein
MRTKLLFACIISAIIPIAMMLILGIVSLVSILSIQEADHGLYDRGVGCTQYVANLSRNFLRVRVIIRDMILENDWAKLAKYRADLKDNEKQFFDNTDKLYNTAKGEDTKKATQDIKRVASEFFEDCDKLSEFAAVGRNDEAIAMLRSTHLTGLSSQVTALVNEIIDAIDGVSSGLIEGNAKTVTSSITSVIVLIVVAFMLSIALAVLIAIIISNHFKAQVEKLGRRAGQAANYRDATIIST